MLKPSIRRPKIRRMGPNNHLAHGELAWLMPLGLPNHNRIGFKYYVGVAGTIPQSGR